MNKPRPALLASATPKIPRPKITLNPGTALVWGLANCHPMARRFFYSAMAMSALVFGVTVAAVMYAAHPGTLSFPLPF